MPPGDRFFSGEPATANRTADEPVPHDDPHIFPRRAGVLHELSITGHIGRYTAPSAIEHNWGTGEPVSSPRERRDGHRTQSTAAATSDASPVLKRRFFAHTSLSGTPRRTDCDRAVDDRPYRLLAPATRKGGGTGDVSGAAPSA